MHKVLQIKCYDTIESAKPKDQILFHSSSKALKYTIIIKTETGTGRCSVMAEIKRRLLNLAAGEMAAIVVFIFVYRTFSPGEASLAALFFLIFILLQGIAYWLFTYLSLTKRVFFHTQAARICRIFRKLNLALFPTVLICLAVLALNWTDLLVGAGIYLFALIEYTNYYWYRLSYGTTGFNLVKLFQNGLRKSHMNKFINRNLPAAKR